jgi:uncharacterized membrane protein (UPF0127 family)
MNKIFITASALVFLAASCNLPIQSTYKDGTVELAGKKISIEVASTPFKRSQGLSGRDGLTENEGMLFLFDEPSRSGFWMKDMKFAIDIVWIMDGKVVDIAADAQPQPGKQDHELAVYSPKNEADTVLELSSGWTKQNNIAIGDEVVIKIK